MVIGNVDVEPLVDAVGVLGSLAERFPGTDEETWRRSRLEHPQLFAGTSWRLVSTCYLIRSADRTVLVDTGVGPPGLWNWDAEWEGGLPSALDRHGLAPDDVDLVLLTHVHFDHVGWNTDASGRPLFARYVLHADALAAARDRADRPHIARCIRGIEKRLETFDGATELAPGVTAVALPGHDPGHIGVRVGTDAILIVDAVPHPALLDRPEIVFDQDADPDTAVAIRRELIAELTGSRTLAICGHYPDGGIGRVVERDGHVAWEAA